jgi:hypothetical protein
MGNWMIKCWRGYRLLRRLRKNRLKDKRIIVRVCPSNFSKLRIRMLVLRNSWKLIGIGLSLQEWMAGIDSCI